MPSPDSGREHDVGPRVSVDQTPRVDAHQHLWDRGQPGLGWLIGGREQLNRTFDTEALRDGAESAGVAATILVQAANTAHETERLLATAAATDLIAGVVAWAPLEDPGETATMLHKLRGNPKFRGVRHIITREPDPDWLLRPAVLASLGLLAEAGATFDVVAVSSRHLENTARVAERLPDLDLVVDHLGAPPLAGAGWEPWASLLTHVALHPRVHAKLSIGLDVLDTGWNWPAGTVQRYVDHALDCFGPERLMAASNWPVCQLAASYTDVWRHTDKLLSHLSPAHRRTVAGGTATKFYGLAAQGQQQEAR